MTTVCISGGFDPIHVGHLDLIEDAYRYGKIIVILNSDAWLERKKGYKFMCWEDRARIISALKKVDWAVSVDDSDGTVCEALARIKPDYFANGGDRFSNNTPEKQVCEELGIKLLFNIGGGKVCSSSKLVDAANSIRGVIKVSALSAGVDG